MTVAIALVSSLATWQWASAQQRTITANDLPVKTGDEIGFRVQYVNGNKASGRLVVKVNGRWIDADPSVTFTPLSH